MFRFAMHFEDAAGHVQKARSLGIIADDRFTHRRWESFCRRHPGYDVWNGQRPWSEADDEYDSLSEEVDFYWPDVRVLTPEDAVRLVTSVFLAPPVRVWLGGKEHVLRRECREPAAKPVARSASARSSRPTP